MDIFRFLDLVISFFTGTTLMLLPMLLHSDSRSDKGVSFSSGALFSEGVVDLGDEGAEEGGVP